MAIIEISKKLMTEISFSSIYNPILAIPKFKEKFNYFLFKIQPPIGHFEKITRPATTYLYVPNQKPSGKYIA
jgi:hypothetical protein